MELTDVDLVVRLVSVNTNIKKEQLVTGKLSDEQSHCVLHAIDRLSQSRLHIVFGSGYTSSDVRAYALQVQAAEGTKPALIVVGLHAVAHGRGGRRTHARAQRQCRGARVEGCLRRARSAAIGISPTQS